MLKLVLDHVPTISMDLMYLHTEGINPNLAVVDHESVRVWSYALPHKAVLTGRGWIQNRLAKDDDSAGRKDAKIVAKIRREKVMAAFQAEIQKMSTARAIPINTPVGQSEAIGRAENAI